MAESKTEAIRISSDTKAEMNKLRERYGLGMNSIADRVLMWFSDQPEESQSAILMSLPESMQSDFAAFALQRMADRLQLDEISKESTETIKPNFHGRPKSKPQFAAKSGPRSSPGQPKPKP